MEPRRLDTFDDATTGASVVVLVAVEVSFCFVQVRAVAGSKTQDTS
jgi:hypothetical protein